MITRSYYDEESTSSQILEIMDKNIRKTYKSYTGKKDEAEKERTNLDRRQIELYWNTKRAENDKS